MRNFSKNIVCLGIISFFTDMASEMLYPVTPVFMATVLGSSMAFIGLVEGLAELTAGLVKGYAGRLADSTGKPSRLVSIGYSISALAKPLPGFFPAAAVVLGARVADRIGKGIRTAPRDAILAWFAGSKQGAAFGFHRAFDTAGAVVGPLLGLLLLSLFKDNYSLVFIAALVPGLAAAAVTFLVADPPSTLQPSAAASFRGYFSASPAQYKKLLAVYTLFSLVNSSDVFLILRASGISGSSVTAVVCYLLFNVVYAATAYPLGMLSDRVGKHKVFRYSLVVFAGVYAGFSFASGTAWLLLLFPVYGIYAAGSEGVVKAWVADIVPQPERGRAIGLLAMVSSFATFIGSVATGFLWDAFGAWLPFLISSVVTLILAGFLPSGAPRTNTH